ncbi:DUF2007 domain-containing protein [Sphingomicrobium sp. XHP0239]|uniref:putative signal transducing protein n=1 Tax=Sphingomicrobium maritimum TaxID=3133972 RepID=UPI0031CC862F
MSLAEAGRFPTQVEAELAKHQLQHAGIPSFTFDEGLNSVFGGGGLAWVRLMVAPEELEAAVAVLTKDGEAG